MGAQPASKAGPASRQRVRLLHLPRLLFIPLRGSAEPCEAEGVSRLEPRWPRGRRCTITRLPLSAPEPDGTAVACKATDTQFDSGRRLNMPPWLKWMSSGLLSRSVHVRVVSGVLRKVGREVMRRVANPRLGESPRMFNPSTFRNWRHVANTGRRYCRAQWPGQCRVV